jgi:hypothetical protein
MVQIPEFKAKTAVTSQTGTRARPVSDITAAAAAPFEAAAELAGDVQQISSRFYQAQTSLQRKTEASKLIDQYLKGDENKPGLNQLIYDAQNNPDTNTALPNFQKGSESLIANLASGAKDPVVKQLFTSKANEIYNNEYLGVQSGVWGNIRKNAEETLNNNIELAINQHITAGGNTAKKAVTIPNIKKLFSDANQDGLGLPDSFLEEKIRGLYTLEASNLITDNPDIFMQNLQNGYYNDKLDTVDIVAFRARAIGVIEARNKTAIANVKTEVKLATDKQKEITDVTKEGILPGIDEYGKNKQELENLNNISKSLGLPNLDQEINDLESYYLNAGKLDSLRKYTRDDFIDELERERDVLNQLKDPNEINIQKNLVDNMEKILTDMNQEIPDNMLGYYEKIEEGFTLPEIDFTKPLSIEEYFLRYTIANKAKNQIDPRLDTQYATKNETLNIENILKGTDKDAIETTLSNMYLIAQEDTPNFIKSISPNIDPGMSHAAALLQGGRTTTTNQIIEGYIGLQNDNNQSIYNGFIKENDLTEEIVNMSDTILSADFRNQHPQTAINIKEAADLIFFDKVVKNIDNIRNKNNKRIREIYIESIQAAAGLSYKRDGKPYGGFAEYQEGNYILLPSNMVNGDYDSDSPNIKEILEDRMDLNLLEKSLGGSIPVDPEGNEVPIESFLNEDGGIKDAFYFETIGRGQYYITAGNPVNFEASYYKDSRGRPIIFNLEIIADELLQEREVKKVNIGEVRGRFYKKK